MKKPVQYLSLLAVLAATTAALCLAFIRGDSKGPAILENGTTVETLDVKFDNMAPGAEKTSSVSFDLEKGYELFASFREGEENGLNDYVSVRISSASVMEDSTLKALFEAGEVSLGKDVAKVDLTYYLPLESGNETQNQSGSFWVDFVARRG